MEIAGMQCNPIAPNGTSMARNAPETFISEHSKTLQDCKVVTPTGIVLEFQ